MPKIIVEIEYDQPDDPYWMNPDNLAICLNAYCGNSDFKVKWAENGDPWRKEKKVGNRSHESFVLNNTLRINQAIDDIEHGR